MGWWCYRQSLYNFALLPPSLQILRLSYKALGAWCKYDANHLGSYRACTSCVLLWCFSVSNAQFSYKSALQYQQMYTQLCSGKVLSSAEGQQNVALVAQFKNTVAYWAKQMSCDFYSSLVPAILWQQSSKCQQLNRAALPAWTLE